MGLYKYGASKIFNRRYLHVMLMQRRGIRTPYQNIFEPFYSSGFSLRSCLFISIISCKVLFHNTAMVRICDEKPKNTEIAVFLCRKLLLFGVEYVIITKSDKMH